jgi:ABC-type phosphate/phosphonate transport system permease subunit
VISGGLVSAYAYQQRLETPMTPGDGALAGLLAGIVGAFVYLVLSIPINLLIGPWERVLLDRFREGMPPDFRDFVASQAGGSLFVMFGFIVMLFIGSIFATIGGLLGSIFFRKSPPRAVIDVPPAPTDVTPPSA